MTAFSTYLKAALLLIAATPINALPNVPGENFRERNFKTISAIYNLTVFPNNLPIVERGAVAVPPGLFAKNVVGRVSPVGNFTGFEDSIEYFFGLAPVPGNIPTSIGFYAADISHFSSECPTIASSVVQLRTAVLDPKTGAIKPGSPKTTLKQAAFFKFDDNGDVVQYEAWIPNLALWTNVANGVPFDNFLVQAVVPATLCPVIQQRCTGKNQQYESTVSCLTNLWRKPFGTFDESWKDNIVCRNIHMMLTQVRPEAHCPHVGPIGGAPPDNYKCVDVDFNAGYNNDKELFGSDKPFLCPPQGKKM